MTAGLGLQGRHALVTGAGSNMGRACVRRLRAEGMTVAEGDPDDRAGADRAVEQALAVSDGRIDLLVTTPDLVLPGSIEATGEDGFARVIEANLTAAFRAGRACFAAMRSRGGGAMVLVSGAGGIRADHETAAYSVASAGVVAVAELFAAEGASYGIRANAVCPGGVATGEDVASVVAWLASAQSARVSGATLRVDGAAGAAMVVDTRG
jgi:NAD(P)-dependent dehydrogenase (short-subunit alcohol dehydrogenase family)